MATVRHFDFWQLLLTGSPDTSQITAMIQVKDLEAFF